MCQLTYNHITPKSKYLSRNLKYTCTNVEKVNFQTIIPDSCVVWGVANLLLAVSHHCAWVQITSRVCERVNNNNNNWNLYSAFSIHKMFKSAAHCHSLSNSPQRLNGRAWKGVFWDTSWRPDTMWNPLGVVEAHSHNLGALMEKARSPNLSLVRGSSRRELSVTWG